MQSRSQETRIEILNSANALFSRNGYAETSVAEICELASVSKGAFYYHFATKQELLLALLENWLNGLDQTFETIQEKSRSVPDAILEMADTAGTVLQSQNSNLPIILEFWMQAYRDPAIWEAAVNPYHRYIKYFTLLFQKGIQEGSLDPIDPDVAARFTVSLGLGLLLQALFEPANIRWDIALQKNINLLIDAMRRSSD